MPKCKSCGAEIVWVESTSGGKMPCNPELVDFVPDCGTETFVTPLGKVKRGLRGLGGIMGYIPHIATCQNAKKHRKRGKK